MKQGELIYFSASLYHYIDSSVFLVVARRGPLNPPLISCHTQQKTTVTHTIHNKDIVTHTYNIEAGEHNYIQ